MSKKKSVNYSQNLIHALNKLPSPIYDERHDVTVYLDDNKARSNQSRFQHIARNFHELKVKDIESIPLGITKQSVLKKDKKRKDTYNYYYLRKSDKRKFIKISILITDYEKRIGTVKSLFVTGTKK